VLQGQKNKDNICYLDGQALKRNHDNKVKKKMKFSNIVEVLGDTSVGGGLKFTERIEICLSECNVSYTHISPNLLNLTCIFSHT